MTIRQLLYALIGILGLIALIGGAFEADRIRDELQQARWIAATNQLTDLTLRASSIMAMERGITAAIVAAPQLAGEDMHAEMQRQRAAGDQLYLRISSHIIPLPDTTHPITTALHELALRRGELERARHLADQRANDNAATLTESQWIQHASNYIEALAELRRATTAPVSEEGHAYGANTLVKETLFTIGEYAGRERAIIGTAIAQQRPLNAAEKERLNSYRITVEQELRRLQSVLKHFPSSSELTSALSGLSAEFLGRYQDWRQQIYHASEQRQPYPLSTVEWYREATRGIDSVIAVSDAVSAHIASDVALIQERSIRISTLLAIAIAGIATIFVLTTLLIRYRLIRPLHRLERAAHVMVNGDLTQPIHPENNDELGSLANTIDLLRETLLEDIQEREHSAKELGKLSQAVEQSTDAILITNAEHIIEYVNPAFIRSRGYAINELVGQNARILKTAENDPAIYQQMNEALKQGRPFHTILINRRKNGTLLHEEMSISPMRNATGDINHYVYTGKDITERILSERELRKLTLAIEHSVSAIVITDTSGTVEYINPQFTRISGYGGKEIIGKKISLIKSDKTPRGVYKELWDTINGGQVWEGEILNRRKNGELYWELVSISPVRNEAGEIINFVGIQHDISARKAMEEQINRMAFHDELTQLPNRSLLAKNFAVAVTRAQREGGILGLLSLDLSRFKLVNDSMGHDIGDQLLRIIAQRLVRCAREHDTVARFGGDEFVVLLTQLTRPEDITPVVQRILASIADPIPIAGQELQLAGNVGAALFPQDGDNLETLMRSATAALHQAKRQGRNQFQFYTSQLSAQATEQLTMENELRRAISEGQLVLHYQPQIDLDSGRIVGAEALVRWPHADNGLIPPSRFIPLAEETGLIIPLGLWVLREACRQSVAWRNAGLSHLRIAINVSTHQLREPDIVKQVMDTIEESGIPADQLEIELTESAIMEQPAETIELLRRFKKLGIGLAIDDFGTGYSSLSYLHRFPFDTLKIDRSFIKNITTSSDDAAIVRTIIAMAHSLRLNVVAEGVETTEQAIYLRNNNCDQLQGYLFSKPLPAQEFEILLRAQSTLSLPPSSGH